MTARNDTHQSKPTKSNFKITILFTCAALAMLVLLYCLLDKSYDQKCESTPAEPARVMQQKTFKKKDDGSRNLMAKTSKHSTNEMSDSLQNTVNTSNPTENQKMDSSSVQSQTTNPKIIQPDLVSEPDYVIEPNLVIQPEPVMSDPEVQSVPLANKQFESDIKDQPASGIEAFQPVKITCSQSITEDVPLSLSEFQPVQITCSQSIIEEVPLSLSINVETEPAMPIATNSAVFTAIDSDNVSMIGTLIDARIDCTVTNSDGLNAIHYAVSKMKTGVLTLLLDRSVVDVNTSTNDELRRTALHIVCDRAKDEDSKVETTNVALMLLQNGADVNALDATGSTPLSIAVLSNNVELVDLLIKYHSNVNHKVTDMRNSILHVAVRGCNRPILKLLLDAGAETGAVNEFNRMPIHEAATVSCVDALKEFILTRGISGITKNLRSPASSENKFKPENKSKCLFGATPFHYATKFNEDVGMLFRTNKLRLISLIRDKLKTIEFLFLIQADRRIKDEKNKTPIHYVGVKDIMQYFEDRRIWERKSPFNQDVENLARYGETLSSEDSLDYFYHLSRYYLHNEILPDAPDDNMVVSKLTEIELNFLKSNSKGIESYTLNDGTGNAILNQFFRYRRIHMPKLCHEINFIPGLSKNFIKIFESRSVRIRF